MEASLLLRVDHGQHLSPGGGVGAEYAAYRRSHGLSRGAYTAHGHAQLLSLDQDQHTQWVESIDHCVGDGRGHTLLELRPPGHHLNQRRQLGEPRDQAAFTWDIGYMGFAEERLQVMLAHREEGDVLEQHHLLVAVSGHCGNYRCGVDVESREDILIHGGHTGWRFNEALATGILTNTLEDQPDALVDFIQVHGPSRKAPPAVARPLVWVTPRR